ncbi:MAG TPA: tRNA (guanosine(46)-N7)-methyltransferase TrmB [Ferrovibrio sp.]|uniref:tRNA (guanosine(46)-N7)-methyltransferase TrmB n=1 Tax=Ferrovibrio sp. TaxID=1917215 RepID=UPI002ED47BC3
MSDDESAAAPRKVFGRRLIYGRRRGRKLSPTRESRFETWLPRVGFALPPPDRPLDPATLFGAPKQAYWLEIGFGDGTHLWTLAQQHPEIGFIGVEPYLHGVAKLVMRIADAAEAGGYADNIRILTDDARLLLKALPDASIARGFVLFPDPWPKKRHNWRRIVNAETLADWARLLPPGGELRLATDVPDYQRWMLRHVLAEPRFGWLAERSADWRQRPADWPASKYEQKAIAAGRRPQYYRLRRN